MDVPAIVRLDSALVKPLSNVGRVIDPASSAVIPVGDRDHLIGSEAPELTLVEYGDFGCPFCFAAKRPVQSLLDRYDSMRLVWRHFPDTDLHPGADLAAELSELAAVHGKFWEAHSRLLAGRERFSHEDLRSAAQRLELDEGEAEAALRERRFSRPGSRGRHRGPSGRGSRDADLLRGRGAARRPLAPARSDRAGEAREDEAVAQSIG